MSGSTPSAGDHVDADEPDESSDESMLGSVIAERYRILEKLGEGGMGVVYRGEHILMKKPVAIKVLHPEMCSQDEVVQRFEREAIAAGRIDHPNVTVATDFGKTDKGSFFLVLEYVSGQSLKQVLSEEGALTEQRALFIARQVAMALAAAHDAGIVHRDLKPDNVMLAAKAGGDFVKVLDFGIAKVEAPGAREPLTRIGSVFGTPQYMPPEQAAGRPVDHRADLYALGLILYEMLAGRPAFQSEELIALLAMQMTENPAPLSPSVSSTTSEIVMRLLEKEPADRYQDAHALVSELDSLLGPESSLPDSGGASSLLGATVPAATVPTVGEGMTAAALERVKPQLLAVKDALSDSVSVAGKRLPLWVLGLAVGGASMLTIVTLIFLSSDSSKTSAIGASSSPSGPSAVSPDLARVLALAEVGNAGALEQLELRAPGTRSGRQWLALGKGYAATGRTKQALFAFRRAVDGDPAFAGDRKLLTIVRQAVEAEDTREEALLFSAELLGRAGADLLFDVWAGTSLRTPATIKAKELLDTPAVREKASPALSVALGLREERGCSELRALVVRAKTEGDERALRPLQKLVPRKGCGFLRLSDCYSCLRTDDALSEAIAAVEVKNAPRFE